LATARERVLFLCGDNHFDAFARLLESNGFNLRRDAHYDISDEEFHDAAKPRLRRITRAISKSGERYRLKQKAAVR